MHLLRGHRGTSSPSERTQPRRRPYRYLEPGSEPAGTLPLLKAISRVTWGTLKRRRLREREAQPQAAPNDPRGRGPPPPAALGSPQRRPALPVPGCRHPSHTAPRYLRPRHFTHRPGRGRGWRRGARRPAERSRNSPSGEGEPPPAGGEGRREGGRSQRRAERGIPPSPPPPPPPPCGEAGRAPLRPRRRAEAGAPPPPPCPPSGHLGAVPQRRPSLHYLPLHVRAASNHGSPPRRGGKPRPPPSPPRCFLGATAPRLCPPGRCPAALPLRDGLPPAETLPFGGKEASPTPVRRPPPQG